MALNKEEMKRLELTHAEAFCLMEYKNERTGETEVLWNSRDGVTPFILTSRDGNDTMTHVNWNKDQFAPDHPPKVGDRIFVNMNMNHALPLARNYVNEWWDNPAMPMKEHPSFSIMSKEEAAGYFAATFVGNGDSPHVIEVTEEYLKEMEEADAIFQELCGGIAICKMPDYAG